MRFSTISAFAAVGVFAAVSFGSTSANAEMLPRAEVPAILVPQIPSTPVVPRGGHEALIGVDADVNVLNIHPAHTGPHVPRNVDLARRHNQERGLIQWLHCLLYDLLTVLRKDLSPLLANIRATVQDIVNLELDEAIHSLVKDLNSVLILLKDLLKALLGVHSRPRPSAGVGRHCSTLEALAKLVTEIFEEVAITLQAVADLFDKYPEIENAVGPTLHELANVVGGILFHLNVLVVGIIVLLAGVINHLKLVFHSLGLDVLNALLYALGLP